MFWFSLFVISVLGIIFSSIFASYSDSSRMKAYEEKSKGNTIRVREPESSDAWGLTAFCIFLVVVFSIINLIGTYALYEGKFDLRKQEALIPQKTDQKKELISLVRNELSAEQLAVLVDATNMESVVVILGNPAGPAAQILQDRAQQIVTLNQQIYELQNKVDSLSIDICNHVDNIFIPRFPFFSADCQYDFSPQP